MQFDTIMIGDALTELKKLPDGVANCCVTSPPYWALRDYGVEDQIGQEETPEEYVDKLVHVFREVKRVLRDDGTLWLNIGDTYCGTGHKGGYRDPKYKEGRTGQGVALNNKIDGLKPKDLVGIPWMLAFALRADGWYLRSDIVWHKPNAIPESVKDRPTKAHEYIFLLSKSPKYCYDYESIKEPAVSEGHRVSRDPNSHANTSHLGTAKKQDLVGNRRYTGFNARWKNRPTQGRNKRSVWTVPTQPFPEAHFAVYPPALITPCILAGCPVGGTVLDPFAGSGTTAVVAKKLARRWIGIELNPEYAEIAQRRIDCTTYSLFAQDLVAGGDTDGQNQR